MEPFGIDIDYSLGTPAETSDKQKSEEKAVSNDKQTGKKYETTSSETSEKHEGDDNKHPFAAAKDMLEEVLESTSIGERKATAPETSPELIEDSFVNIAPNKDQNMKFVRAIEALEQMGYKNIKTDYMMRVVIEKDGDLQAILDTILPENN